MEIESEQLESYIKSALSAIKNGLKETDFEIVKPIEFDLAIVNTSEGGGGLKIYVAKAEGKLKSEEINHIKFEVQLKYHDSVHVYHPENAGFNKGR